MAGAADGDRASSVHKPEQEKLKDASTRSGRADLVAALFQVGCATLAAPGASFQLPAQSMAGESDMQLILYGTVQVDGLSIFSREAGPRDAPSIFLLHGLRLVSRRFHPSLRRLRGVRQSLKADRSRDVAGRQLTSTTR